MTDAATLIPELGQIIRNGEPKRRAEAARRIAGLFFEGAATLQDRHVDFLDNILIDLVPYAELNVRAEIAERMSLYANAPPVLVGRLARENDILVASPVLKRSPVLDEETLIEIAQVKGPGHLLALAERKTLSSEVTDAIVRRGDREAVRRAAGNAGARFSERGYSELIRRAGQDGVLTLAIGQRDDLSDQRLKDLLAGSLDVIRRRLFDVVKPERQNAIKQAMAETSDVPASSKIKRDFARAQRTILALHKDGGLGEAALLHFAKIRHYEEAIAALAALSGVGIGVLDNLVQSDRYDPILIVGKAIGLEWATVRALILLRLGPNRTPAPTDIETARLNFARLMPSTAERVVAFWKTRFSPY
jgi:uncharacterized protein (DUF2336 family)